MKTPCVAARWLRNYEPVVDILYDRNLLTNGFRFFAVSALGRERLSPYFVGSEGYAPFPADLSGRPGVTPENYWGECVVRPKA